jgi:hypothetical protein
MHLPRLSVITAVYNGEKYLAETIESVLNQTFSDFEYILIDDCSSDGSIDVILSFKDSRIKLLRNAKNERLVITRNIALAASRGEYIALTDQDDVSITTRFARQICELDKNKRLGLVASWFDLINAASQKHGNVIRRTYTSDELKTSLMFRNPICNSTVMVRKLAMASPPYDPNFPLCEDYNFIVNIAEHWQIAMLQTVLLQYRTHDSNYSSVKAKDISTLGNQIKLRQIQRHLPNVDPHFQTVHNSLENLSKATSLEQLEDIHFWLSTLLNHLPQYTKNSSQFRNVIAREWFEAASKAAWLGPRVWDIYQSSQIPNAPTVPFLHRMKLKAKCLIRMH